MAELASIPELAACIRTTSGTRTPSCPRTFGRNTTYERAQFKKKQITAAVFPGPSLARVNVMQDWGRWKLDAVLPILYSGLYIGQLPADEFRETAKAALDAGAAGVALFSDSGMSAAKWAALRQISSGVR